MSRPLNIFLSCQQSPVTYPVPPYEFWTGHFSNGLSEAGHSIRVAERCDWARGLLPLSKEDRLAWMKQTWTAAIEQIEAEHRRHPIDLFLSYLYPNQVDTTAVAYLKGLGIPCVNFFCDNVREFRRIPEAFAPFSLHWTPETKAVPLYRKRGFPCITAPMPVWIPHQYRNVPDEEKYPTTFLGSWDEQRDALFWQIVQRGYPIEIRGLSWDTAQNKPSENNRSAPHGAWRAALATIRNQVAFYHTQGALAWGRRLMRKFHGTPPRHNFSGNLKSSAWTEDYWDVVRASNIFVGVNRYPSFRFSFQNPDTYSRLRDIEAPMAGACYLTEWTEGLDSLYDLGKEIETYKNPDEFVDKARQLDNDPNRRKALRRAGQLRALECHSVGKTIERIARELGI